MMSYQDARELIDTPEKMGTGVVLLLMLMIIECMYYSKKACKFCLGGANRQSSDSDMGEKLCILHRMSTSGYTTDNAKLHIYWDAETNPDTVSFND